MKKYELTNISKKVCGKTLYRIKALKNFSNVKEGDLGGWIECEKNLSQDGNCWVYDDAKVFGDAEVYDDAKVCDNAEVFGIAKIYDNAKIYGGAWVYCDAKVFGNSEVSGNVRIRGDAWILDLS